LPLLFPSGYGPRGFMDRLLLTMGDSLEQLPRYPVVTLRVLAPQSDIPWYGFSNSPGSSR